MRINKFIASKTSYSRRKAEELILQKKVKVNGEILNSLSYLVNDGDEVELDGDIISDVKTKNIIIYSISLKMWFPVYRIISVDYV